MDELKHRYTEEERQELVEKFKTLSETMSKADAAKTLNVALATVYGWANPRRRERSYRPRPVKKPELIQISHEAPPVDSKLMESLLEASALNIKIALEMIRKK